MSVVDDEGAVLVERGVELAECVRALDGAQAGRGALVVVQGPAGIGKTRLLDAAGDHGRTYGLSVCRARGAEFESGFPFGVLRQLFEPAIRDMPLDRREALRGQAAGLALGLFDGSPATVRLEPSVGLFHGVYWLALAMADEVPLAILVDDAHWADKASLRTLAYLARRLDTTRITIAVAARTAPLGSAMSSLAAVPGARRIALKPLSAGGTRELAGALVGHVVDERTGDACREVTGGNPFLVTELVRHLRSGGSDVTAATVEAVRQLAPKSLSEALMLRFDSLPESAVPVAQAVAVLGEFAAPRRVAALAELSLDETLSALDGLETVGVLVRARLPSFVHPLIEAAVYGSMPEGVRGEAHYRAAELLRGEGAEIESVAALLVASTPAARRSTVDSLLLAGRRAAEGGAFDAAIELLERALREPPRPEVSGRVLSCLGIAELDAGEIEAGTEHLLAALDHELDPESCVVAALAVVRRGSAPDPIKVLDQVAIGVEGELGLRVDVERTSILRYLPGHSDAAMRRMRGYATFPGESSSERLALAALAFARSSDRTASAGETRALASRALQGDALIAQETGDSLLYGQLCYALISCEDFDTARFQLGLWFADAAARASPIAFFPASVAAAWLALLTGDLAGATAHGYAGLEAASETIASLGRTAGAAFLAQGIALAHVERGEPAAAAEAIALVGGSDATPVSSAFIDLARGLLALESGEPEKALTAFTAASASSMISATENRVTRWRLGAARALAALGRHAEAVALADEQLSLDRIWGAPGGLGEAIRVRASIGSADEAIERLEEAVTTLRVSARRLELAHALVDLGVALRRAGQPKRAREPLAEGLDVAADCGARQLADRARSELVVAGARPRRDRMRGKDALTPSEERVAELAAQGHTNRVIAQQLFLTPKTVEVRLTSVYRKLEISGRAELPDALAAPAPASPRAETDETHGGSPYSRSRRRAQEFADD